MKISKDIEITWKPKKGSGLSLFSQIVTYFNDQIVKGNWVPGQRLPSQRRLGELFGVNRSTIVGAMEELASMGLIEGKSGDGTYIASDIWSLMMSYAAPNWQSYIEGGKFMANKPAIQKINQLEYQEGILRLGTGEMSPELYPKEAMKRVLSRISEKIPSLAYLPPLGLLELREALSQYMKYKGIDVSPRNILVVSGSLQALQLTSVCILPPWSTVYMERPSYLASLNVFQSANIVLEGVPMDRSGMMPHFMKTKNLQSGRALLYTIPTFQNPTGNVMPANRRMELLSYCKTHKMPIVEEDEWGELWLDEQPPRPIKTWDSQGIVLYVGSLSKTLAPGLRIGWLAGPEPVVQRLADAKMQMDYGSSSLSQWAAAEWLKSGLFEQHLTVLRRELKKRRDFMLCLLERHFTGLAEWEKPAGGYYVWLKLTGNLSANQIFEKALKENILLNPGDLYDASHKQHLRLCYAYESYENMEKGLLKLAAMLSES